MKLAGVGIWSSQLRYGDFVESAEAAAELEELGYSALWIPDVGGKVFDAVENLLHATERVVVATGILNLWMHEPADVARSYHECVAEYGDRLILGIGVSHAPLVDAGEPGRYKKPLAATQAYLDALDATEQPVPVQARVLAALGPKMLHLSATRANGSHPYLVTPAFTAQARAALGDGPLLLPEQTAILTTDADEARAIGTEWLRNYLLLPNYANNLLRSGFAREDLDSVSDRLFDAMIVWGDEETILRRVHEHVEAGADHVCLQVLDSDPQTYPREQWRRIAAALKQ